MSYEIAKAMNVNVTYGWLITQVTAGGAADKGGLQGGTNTVNVAGTLVTIRGDIVITINGARIRNMDDLSDYLEEYTLPSQAINVTVTKSNVTLTLSATLGTRPPPT